MSEQGNLDGQPLNPEGVSENTQGEDFESKNKQLYARLQKEKEAREALEAKLSEFEANKEQPKEQPKTEHKEFNPLESIELFKAVKDLDENELSLATKFAKADGKDIKEVVASEDFKEIIEARREKKTKDNAGAKPSNNNPASEKSVDEMLESGGFSSLNSEDFAKAKAEMDRKFSRKHK